MSLSPNEVALLVTGVDFKYGNVPILDDIHLDVGEELFVALLGANGAGKTTLFSIITGLYAAHAGSVSIGGFDLRQNTQQALASIGVVFQKPTLDRDLTVIQNLRYFCQLQGIERKLQKSLISETLEMHELSDMSHQKVSELSGGQQRRVELARAIMHKPRLLLLDEPTVGLDHRNRLEFVAKVKQLCKETGTGVLWATHLMDEVEDADHLYILHYGKIVSSGSVDSLKAIHKKESVADLFHELTLGQSA